MRSEKDFGCRNFVFEVCTHLVLSLLKLKKIFFAGKFLITHGGSVLNSSQKKFECIMITELDVSNSILHTFL
jgi:hypothetical protein